MMGSGAMALAFFGVSIGVGLGLKMPENHGPGIAAVVFIWMYFSAFSFGWVSVPWLYAAEVSKNLKLAILGHVLMVSLFSLGQ